MPGIEGFELPNALVVDEATATPRYARFTAEPWENGFGHTMGNALRRVLLSSMEGVAVSSIRIDGVSHEFSSIPDVLEDVMLIILNIKRLKFSCDGSLPRTLELYADEAGEVTAANIREDGVTTVLNPEQVICTLDKNRPLRMELELERGRGYRAAEENKREDQPIGTIPVDCLFSPIERVRYDVQACRVGQHTDYDRLELEVWTDGRIDPRDAVVRSAMILREHLGVFVKSEGAAMSGTVSTPVAGLTDDEKELVEKLCTNVNSLELSVRAVNCLNSAQISYLGELVEKSEGQMLKYRNFGRKSLQEIKLKLESRGLNLEMVLADNVRDEMNRLLALKTQNKED
ncbi:MAG: DNA-directed RNA polymerase subunit alpha [Lentisphaeria bacterium]|nr:DNA-directed RNA polymerase subunit alpha [Lentisphaeria bacterium]